MSMTYLPEFITKTESEKNPLPCSFLKSLVGDVEEEGLLCSVMASRLFLPTTFDLSLWPHSFVYSRVCVPQVRMVDDGVRQSPPPLF